MTNLAPYNPVFTHIQMNYFGLKETPGPMSTPKISEWLNEFYWGGDDSKIANCGICMAGSFKEAGYEHFIPDVSYRARNWMNTGLAVKKKNIQYGDLVVFWRGSKYGTKGHVAWFVCVDPMDKNYWYVLGFNQNNTCTISRYAASRYLAARTFKWIED